MPTHDVLNQPPPLRDYNFFTSDRALAEAMDREGAGWAGGGGGGGAGWAVARPTELGATCGRAEVMEWGVQANASPPVLRTHDRYGHRLDLVEYHPAYHQLMRLSVGHGMHALPWREPRPGAHVARAGMFYLTSQVEAGHGCPISMTYSAVPALRVEATVAREWEPRLTSTHYDPRFQPADGKQGALCGMAMTEKQGGSDVRANTTRAEKGDGGWLLTGHKWFCSAPMCDAFLVLAQTAKGLTCFLLPRWRPDGSRNALSIQRLKDKLGNRANASSEIELERAWARRVGPEGRGVPTIIEMVNHTRLDCTIGAAAGMRQAVAQATHHAQHRSAFGKRLIEQPLMQNVLADLCVESEAATAAMMRLARAYDARRGDDGEGLFARLATAVIKYWVCKRWPAHAAEALECLGGNGYVEDAPLARLFRESPLNGIWEGSGNVICLDVLRAMTAGPEVVEAFFAEVDRAHGADPRLDQFVVTLRDDLRDAEAIEARARDLVERMALALQGSLLVRDGDPAVAEAFCASRLGGQHRLAFGTLPPGFHFTRIIERARPQG